MAHAALGATDGLLLPEQVLFQGVYLELRRLAARQMRGQRSDHTLQPTALVHEVFLRLVDQERVDLHDRAQFLALAARAMRWVLVDHARRRSARKRGGTTLRFPLDEALDAFEARSADLVALDQALAALAATNSRHAQIVELRFFSGMTNEEVGKALGLSLRTIEREWRLARAWLRRELDERSTSDHDHDG